MPRKATLIGAPATPCFELEFGFNEERTGGQLLREWVKDLPDRQWVPESKRWRVSGLGTNPVAVLREAGFEVDTQGLSALDLADLWEPAARQLKNDPSRIVVLPRLAGRAVTEKVLGGNPRWNKDRRWFEVGPGDLLRGHHIKMGLNVNPPTAAAAMAWRAAMDEVDQNLARNSANIARSTGVDLDHATSMELEDLIDLVGDVPESFKLDLFPYQRVGALCMAAGRTFNCDAPGLGKTRTALAAAEIRGWKRILLVVPPVTLTHWARQAHEAGMATELPATRGKKVEVDPEGRWIVVIKTGRKDGDWPVEGIVITADSMLASRKELQYKAVEWAPDHLIYDEAHRAKTWESARATAMRAIAAQIRAKGGVCMCLTGTPMPSGNHAELASQLDITGHLDSVFGGYGAFVDAFCRLDQFRKLVSKKGTSDALRRKLVDYVMVRRNKRDVLSDLPPCSITSMVVDVDDSGYRAAHGEVLAKIDRWLERWAAEHGRELDPFTYSEDETDVAEYANNRLDIISPMRIAAGKAKIPAAVDFAREWSTANQSEAKYAPPTWTNPLIIWVHHHEVIEALTDALKPALKGGFGVISGKTSGAEKDRLVDAYQAGQIGVLVCGITAAGVGITLTRGSDSLFLESDWTPANIEQAIGRQDRIGQQGEAVMGRMMYAPNTLDGRIQTVLKIKSQEVDATMGADANGPRLYIETEEGAVTAGSIVAGLVNEAILLRKKKLHARAKTAVHSTPKEGS